MLLWILCLRTRVSRSLDLTGSDWGLRKKHKDRHRKSWGEVGLTLLVRCWWPPPPPSAFIYTACMRRWSEMQVEFSWVQWRLLQEQGSCGMLLLMQTILTTSACPVFPARQPCWTLLTSSFGALPSQHKGPWHDLAYVKVSSQCI
jgi:hypothetical protein